MPEMGTQTMEETQKLLAEQIRLAQQLLIQQGEPQSAPVTEFPVEVTCVIPVYNAFLTLGRCLFHLEHGAQAVPLQLLLCDNGSTDPCRDVLANGNIQKWCAQRGFADPRVLPMVPQLTHDMLDGRQLAPQERINKNLEFVWKKLAMATRTPYILYVDSDVLMPTGGVRAMLDALKEDEKLAMVGILYDWKVDHVQLGCAMGRTEVMQRVNFRSEGCPCRWLTRHLREEGHKIEYLPPDRWTAVHLKSEKG